MSEKTVKFHIESDDYFGTLATILSLWQQKNEWPEGYNEVYSDLIHLQKEYKIIKKKVINFKNN